MPERYAAERDARPRDHMSMERSREPSRHPIGEALYGLVIPGVQNGARESTLPAASWLSTLGRTGARPPRTGRRPRARPRERGTQRGVVHGDRHATRRPPDEP